MSRDSTEKCLTSLDKLSGWIVQNGLEGWDIYDGLNNPSISKIKCRYLKLGLIQLNKYSPINFRPILNIQKGIDLKGLTLLAYAEIMQYKLTNDVTHLNKYEEYNTFLVNKSLKNEVGYHSWSSHYFPYITVSGSNVNHFVPDIIVTSRMIIQLVEGYKRTNKCQYKDIALNASDFLVNKLYSSQKSVSCFKYYYNYTGNKIVYNASSHALEALSSILSIYESQKIHNIIQSTVKYLLDNQNSDGSWKYSIVPDKNKTRTQLDFHQGYMLDGLIAAYPYVKEKERLLESIERGAAFYKNIMFRKNGSSYFRYPKPFPIDIHNQAQGIITFSKLGVFKKEYSEFATTILDWTIENMQDPTGYFYYQKWPFITNQIPYMRWSEAWMMVALSTYRKYSSSCYGDMIS